MKTRDLQSVLDYMMTTASVYACLSALSRPTSARIADRIRARIAELREEEARLVATRAYMVELWRGDDEPAELVEAIL